MSNTTDTAASDRSRRIKMWGVGIVVLMIVLMLFPINLTGRGQRGGSSSPTIGTTRDGTNVTADDRARAARMLEVLEGIYVGLGDTSGPLPEVCWGTDVVNGFRRDPEALHLAILASRRIGLGTSPVTLGPLDPDERSDMKYGIFNSGTIPADELHPLASSPLGEANARRQIPGDQVSIGLRGVDRQTLVPITSLSTAEQRIRYDALNDFLTLQSAASVTASALKVSAPVVDRVIAEQYQRLTVKLAAFDASAELSGVPEPSEAQLAEHFAKFAGSPAGVASASNPFGFGYRVADRVRVEWISLDRAAIRAAVEAEKKPYDWEVETRIAYAKEPARFASLAPSTQPAVAAPASSQPAFESVSAGAIRLNIDHAADARASEIERRMRTLLTNDYQAWTAARTTNATTAPTAVGAPIEAADYLDKIATSVGRQFKITPTVERLNDALRDQAALAAASPSFASLQRVGSAVNRVTGARSVDVAPAYAVRAAATQPAAERAAAEESLAPYQPSQTMTDASDSKRAIFRVTDAAANKPATDLASVRDRVIADWKIAQAEAIALKKATAAAEAVRTNQPTAASLPWKTVTLDLSPIAASALGVTNDALAQLREAANDVLLGGAATAKPAAALDVPLARRAYVAQRESLVPSWQTEAALETLRGQGRAYLAGQMSQPKSIANPFGLTDYAVGGTWLNVAKIYERAGWTPVRNASN